jgi:uncharacterized protein YqhQ
MSDQELPVGGQALQEGVMMRRGQVWAAAVRMRDGSIELDRHEMPETTGRFRKLPVVRGNFNMVESVRIGFRALTWSANKRESSGEGFSTLGIVGATAIAITFLIGIFNLLPAALAKVLGIEGAIAFNAFEGAVRISLFVAYLAVMGLVPDIRRVFQYHGAEHKTVSAFEAGAPLTPEGVRPFTRRHTRCGTTFLLMVLVLTIVVNTAFGDPSWGVLVASRVLTIPLVAGLAYELIRYAGSHWEKRWVRIVMTPGLWLQDLTTRDPDDDMIEVAIASLVAVLPADHTARVNVEAPQPQEAPAGSVTVTEGSPLGATA